MDRRIRTLVVMCTLLLVAVVGTGYAVGFTSETDIRENAIESSYITLSPGGTSSYSGSFSKEVEFHLGTIIVDDVRTTVYSPCSWFIKEVNGIGCYDLGTMHLVITSPDDIGALSVTMVATNPLSISDEFEYLVVANSGEYTEMKTFDRFDGVEFDTPAWAGDTLTYNGLDMSLYLKVKTLEYLPSLILNDTVFSFTVTSED